jgi:hypothetical protein
VAMILGMARRYIKLSNCGTTVIDDDDDVEIAVTVVIVGKKHRWGGSTPGHKIYRRDREGVNKKLNAQYFVKYPIYNSDHFRRRCVPELKLNFYYIVNQVCGE